MGATESGAKALTIGELTELIKTTLEEGFPSVLVQGEISNWRPASSGHCYFTLKDDKASIQAVMFRGRAQRLAFDPADGLLVQAKGALSVYPPRGAYQIVVETMERAGVGDLLARLEELKRKLSAEGLFDEDRKREIPRFPARVCVITSPTGAAIRDILNVVGRRNSGLRVLVLPAAVQGAEAPAQLKDRLAQANLHDLGDVIILARGGGSIEDLAAFNDEKLVRAVAASRIPVISAVGHEIDWTLCDFAADLRAPTPSAAAELVSESVEALRSTVALHRDTMVASMGSQLERARLSLGRFEPELMRERFERLVNERAQRFDDARNELARTMRELARERRYRLDSARDRIQAADPEALLARGYAIVRKGGETIRDAAALKEGDEVSVQFAVGSAKAGILEIDATRRSGK